MYWALLYQDNNELCCLYWKCVVAQKGQSQINLPKHKTMSQSRNQFPETQISLPKHKTISQSTNQFTKTQNNFSKHKSIYRNTKQFLKTQTNFSKHKSVYRNSKQFLKTQANFPETQTKRLGTCAVIIRESLDFPCWTWQLFYNVIKLNSSHLSVLNFQ